MRCAFYPGSFDPPTLGHLDVIRRGLCVFDKLIVGIGVHPSKVSLLSEDERVAMLTQELSMMKGTSEVAAFQGLTVEAARQYGAQVIVRGLRNATDFDYENQLAGMNQALAGDIETVFIAASPALSHMTSTLVRQVFKLGGDFSSFVSPGVRAHLLEKQRQI